jgi:IS30 family transposase
MGARYGQLTDEERIEMYAMRQAGRSQNAIARALGRDKSTVSREIRRNRGQRGYRPKQAHQMAHQRREKPRTHKMTAPVTAYVEQKLKLQFSPEQISQTMEANLGCRVSVERIYQHVYQDQRQGGDLYKNLRIASGRKRHKRYGKKDARGQIPNRVGIEQRPALVEHRRRFGDWEGDLICGAHHRGFLVSLVERESRATFLGHVRNKTAEAVQGEILRLLKPHRRQVHTITFDNGHEFAGHEQISQQLGCECYFARPYHSWERGTNENTNGLVRQYFPKGMDLRQVTDEQLEFVMGRLNHRPRKVLGFCTPAVVFCERLKSAAVALGT